MKALKKVFLVIAVLIAGVAILAGVAKKEYSVQRQIEINKPHTEVFSYLKFLKNQDNFSVWAARDPNMKKEFRGTDGTIGFVSAWDSTNKEVGKGEQEIKKITENERIDYELRFLKPFESTEQAYFTTEATSDNSTVVTWGFNGKMPYPMNLMLLFMDFDAMLGKDFDSGLSKLKAILEK
ncbi:MAG: SRPBCC family protein [Leptospiraceae bacterium]|nr:SRPBCC family protein [Leptospiraceae bacterium]